MPTYDYVCRNCDHELELFQSITARPKRKCPQCGRSTLERRIGTGAAILFRGTGFYQTDYRSESYRRDQTADRPASDGAAGKNAAGKDAPAKAKDTTRPAGESGGASGGSSS